MVLSLSNSKSGREQKDHSVIHAIEEVGVQCQEYGNVGANVCGYKAGQEEDETIKTTGFCAISSLPNNIMHNSQDLIVLVTKINNPNVVK